MHDRTVVLDQDYLKSENASGDERAALDAEASNPPVRGGTLTCRGVQFDWWAVGDGPFRVIVHSPELGSREKFTADDVEAFAAELAEELVSRVR